jgi:uncharacterized membrane protein YfcA
MWVTLIVIGLLAGAVSGLVGIGGGIVMVPALTQLLGFSQHQAQGTTLAMMVPPIGLWAAMTYWKQGYVDVKVAAFLCVGFVVGSIVGSYFAVGLPTEILRRVFAGILLVISLRMLFS